MKVSVTLPDALVLEVKRLSRGKNTTDSILLALGGYIAHQYLLKAIQNVKNDPLLFRQGFSAKTTRKLNQP
jgi:hypothetical protein